MAQSKRTSRHNEAYEKEIEWLVEETAKLKLDLASLVLSVPRAIIALARRQDARQGRDRSGRPPPSDPNHLRVM